MERWRPIAGYAGRYEVSDHGRVRSWTAWSKGRLLKPGIASHGYPTVALGQGNTRTLHSLVAAAFLGPCPPDCEVRHWDGNHTNPTLGNLVYGTRSQNNMDRHRHGTAPVGEKNGLHKLTELDVIHIRELAGVLPQREIADMHGCTQSLISTIVNGKARMYG